MSTGYTLITATKIQDAAGHLLPSGRVTFFPVNNLGQPISAIVAGGGVITQTGVAFLVVNGALTTDLLGDLPQLADTTLTNPANICYSVVITDATGTAIQGPGYGLVQPSGTTWSLDTYVPIQPAQVTTQYGPIGPPGPVGTASGTLGLTLYEVNSSGIATGHTYLLQIVNGSLVWTQAT